MERVLQLRFEDGSLVTDRAVSFIKGDRKVDAETDSEGKVIFDWPYDWMDKLEVEQIVVKKDWDLSGGWSGPKRDLGTISIPRQDANSPQDGIDSFLADEDEQGVRGLLFYNDGTLAYDRYKVELEFDTIDSPRYSTEDKHSYCHDNGEFFVQTGQYRRGKKAARVWVNGDEIPRNMFHRTREGMYAVIIPGGWGRGKGTKGGLITGWVLEEDGSPASGAKIMAEIASSGFFSFMSDTVTTYSGSKGSFILPFTGGITVKRLYVDGNDPVKMEQGRGEHTRQVPNKDIPAGTFSLNITRKKKGFFSF